MADMTSLEYYLLGTNRLHLQGRRIIRAKYRCESRWRTEEISFLRNVGCLSMHYMALYPRRQKTLHDHCSENLTPYMTSLLRVHFMH
jgi:hypothetical protein